MTKHKSAHNKYGMHYRLNLPAEAKLFHKMRQQTDPYLRSYVKERTQKILKIREVQDLKGTESGIAWIIFYVIFNRRVKYI